MEFFLDTANVDEIKEAHKLGVIKGVTTNPSLIAKSGRKMKDVILEIDELMQGKGIISVEVNPNYTSYEQMLAEAKEIVSWTDHESLVVKLPFGVEGLKCCHECDKLGIAVNMTLIFSANQALLAANAGASYVSPFLGRLDDIGHDGISLVERISTIFNAGNIDTDIICASVRNSRHVEECASLGAEYATIPYSLLLQMIDHPLTTQGILKFQKDFSK